MVRIDGSTIIGMVHLKPLAGAPEFDGDREAIIDRALADARTLAEGGVDAVLVENFGDAPFYPDSVPHHVVAEMTRAGTAIQNAIDIPVGINVLRNDATAALSVAAATGGEFIRVNVHTGAKVTDQGRIDGRAHETIRLRERIDATNVRVFADVGVKHASALGAASIAAETRDLIERGAVDAVIVSGAATGESTDTDELQTVTEIAHQASIPVLVGSGATPDTIDELLTIADGAIVGSAMKVDGNPSNPVDEDRVEEIVNVR